MLRRMQAVLVVGVWVVALPAAAQPTDEPLEDEELAPEEPMDEPVDEPADEAVAAEESTAPSVAEEAEASPASPQVSAQVSAQLPTAPPVAEPAPEPVEKRNGWRPEVHGYFRAPMSLGISSRPNPETKDVTTNTFDGEDHTQISYGPTRTIDSNYYSFAYTRLQEQDWAEVTVHAKKKHVDAAIGWMGYWYQAAGFRNSDASWAPGIAYLALDTDFEVIPGKENQPNIMLTAGAWWPKFGYFEKYDTYTLGQLRQVGEQVKLTVPVNPDLTTTLTHGIGTSRDGSFQTVAPPPYQGRIGLDLIHYENVQFTYGKYVDVSLHYNREWTRDPFLWQGGVDGVNYADVQEAHLRVIGGEASVFVPRAGRLWVSPSYISVKNGWAFNWAGTEVMHSIAGNGIARNYMAYTRNPTDSTGTGSMINLGFLYENTLSNIQGKESSNAPEVTLNVFGLFTEARRDLPDGSSIGQEGIKQLKYGADVTLQAMNWLGVMLRYDEVNYDLDNPGYVFSAISPRVIFSSHFLSGESIYIQYSRYRYGDNMTLAATWPWGTDMIEGTRYYAQSPYTGQKPDMDVLRIQASVAF